MALRGVLVRVRYEARRDLLHWVHVAGGLIRNVSVYLVRRVSVFLGCTYDARFEYAEDVVAQRVMLSCQSHAATFACKKSQSVSQSVFNASHSSQGV